MYVFFSVCLRPVNLIGDDETFLFGALLMILGVFEAGLI